MKKSVIKRGRPIGATSTVRVKMKDLMRHLTGEATVVVGKTWLEEIGLGVDEVQIAKIKVVKETDSISKVEVKSLF